MANDQQQRPTTNKLKLSDEQATKIALLTIREGWLEFTVEDIQLIAEDFPPAPPSTALLDFKKFVYLASQKGLNPILGDLHYEYHGDRRSSTGVKGVAVIHQQAELKIANRTGLLDGINQEDGTDERGLHVITYVYKKGCANPFYFKAYHNEFVQPGGFLWPKSPYNMTAKCSRVGCLRIAFPELSGLVGEAEVDDGFSNGFTPEPASASPAPSIKIGEKKPTEHPTDMGEAITKNHAAGLPPSVGPDPLGDLSRHQSSAATPTPTPLPPQPPPPGPIPAPAPPPKPVPTPVIAETDYAAQYKARLAVLVGKDSEYAKRGLTKDHVYNFLCGYFGVAGRAQLPKDPDGYPVALDKLMVLLEKTGPEAFEAFLADPISAGFNLMPKPGLASEIVSTPSLSAAIKAQFNWNVTLVAIAEKLLTKSEIVNLDDFGKMISEAMPKFTEPQLETAFLVGYYDPTALNALLKAFRDPKNKMPLSYFRREIELSLNQGLDTLECDPAKVAEAVMGAIEKLAKK